MKRPAVDSSVAVYWLICGVSVVLGLFLTAVVIMQQFRIDRLEEALITTNEVLNDLRSELRELTSGYSEDNGAVEDLIQADEVALDMNYLTGNKHDHGFDEFEDSDSTNTRFKRGKGKGKGKDRDRDRDKTPKKCKPKKGTCNAIAAHIVGNGNTGMSTVNVLGDGKLNLWKYADWMNNHPNKDKFLLSVDGTIIIKEGGLYYIYSQVTYKDANNQFLGHAVHVGQTSHKSLSCKYYHSEYAFHSCFTAGIFFVSPGDKIHVSILGESDEEYGITGDADTTFLGLIKLGS